MNILIAVDVQHDFLDPDGAIPVPNASQILAPILTYAHEADLVIATADWHPSNHKSFDVNGGPWPVHCEAGTPGAEIYGPLNVDTDIVIHKGTDPDTDGYSAFDGTVVEELLRGLAERHPGNLHVSVAGLATDYCVKRTALDAERLGQRDGYDVAVLLDASRGVSGATTDDAIAQLAAAGVALKSREVA
jgi:nicotinamidase-related amidase